VRGGYGGKLAQKRENQVRFDGDMRSSKGTWVVCKNTEIGLPLQNPSTALIIKGGRSGGGYWNQGALHLNCLWWPRRRGGGVSVRGHIPKTSDLRRD